MQINRIKHFSYRRKRSLPDTVLKGDKIFMQPPYKEKRSQLLIGGSMSINIHSN
jgi:hypothetical protein